MVMQARKRLKILGCFSGCRGALCASGGSRCALLAYASQRSFHLAARLALYSYSRGSSAAASHSCVLSASARAMIIAVACHPSLGSKGCKHHGMRTDHCKQSFCLKALAMLPSSLRRSHRHSYTSAQADSLEMLTILSRTSSLLVNVCFALQDDLEEHEVSPWTPERGRSLREIWRCSASNSVRLVAVRREAAKPAEPKEGSSVAVAGLQCCARPDLLDLLWTCCTGQ